VNRPGNFFTFLDDMKNKIANYIPHFSTFYSMKFVSSVWCLGLILVSIMVITGCINTPPQPVVVMKPVNGTMISFNESDNGKAYEIPRNTNFFVNVTESFATGTKWHPKVSPGLELVDDGYYANPESIRVDIGGTRSWRLRATGTGQQSFQADFYQFSDSDKVQEHYALTLQVRPDSG
jgi:predicted secreted protein